MFAGALDAGFIGPNPAINMFHEVERVGRAHHLGVTSGGRRALSSALDHEREQLPAKTTPPRASQHQDVALRYSQAARLQHDQGGGGDVKIRPRTTPVTIDAFPVRRDRRGLGAEPNVARLVDAGARSSSTEASQWPGGKFVTTVPRVCAPTI